jgi:hypothetical protein
LNDEAFANVIALGYAASILVHKWVSSAHF